MWLTKRRVEEERESVLTAKRTVVQAQAAHEEHEATRLSAEEAVAEAAASVTAVLNSWQAAETSRWRVVEASKKSAEVLHAAQRESDAVLHNMLKSVEDFDKQVHSITMSEDSLVLGSGGRSLDFLSRWKGSLQGFLNDLPYKASSAPRSQTSRFQAATRPRGFFSIERHTPEIGTGAGCAMLHRLP